MTDGLLNFKTSYFVTTYKEKVRLAEVFADIRD